MIDFSNYTIYQQQAMNDVLHDLVERLEDYGTIWEYLREMRAKSDTQLTISIDAQFDQQALDMKELEWQEQAAPPEAPPAEEPVRKFNVQALVDGLSWCSDCCNALAIGEDIHFSVCSETEVFNKATMLQDCKRALNNMVSDIRDHYDGLH